MSGVSAAVQTQHGASQAALDRRPDLAAADLIAQGRAAMGTWRLDAALAAFEAALVFAPSNAEAHYLRGEALFLLRRLDAALASHDIAFHLGLEADPQARGRAMSGMVPGDFAWMSHMLRGDFEGAWRWADRDRERRRPPRTDARYVPRHERAVWDGTPLGGRRVLVRCYHGLGDTIQFVRLVPRLALQARYVVVEAQPELLPLLASVPGIDRLVPLPAEDLSPADYGCDAEADVTDLPHALRLRLETIRPEVPYLAVPGFPAAPAGGRPLRVGLVWAAGGWKPERSVAIAALAPLASIPGIEFVSLQRGPEYERWRVARDGPPVVAAAQCDDIVATAILLGGLDLVISVDTMVAHLAGALGVPCWILLHYAADWRWLLHRSDSPWYPTARLFRQPAPGAWDDVVRDVATALRTRAAA